MDLDVVKQENVEFIGRCKCCLEDADLHNLWEEYYHDGQMEVYGTMLVECFSVNWEYKDQDEYICNSCIVRLRDALNFKREIIASEQALEQVQLNYKQDDIKVAIKIEQIDDVDDYREVEYLDLDVDSCAGSEEKLQSQLKSMVPTDSPKRKWPKKRTGADRLKVYKKYTQLEFREAMEAVRSGKMSCTEAADAYNIPRNTLSKNLNKLNTLIETQNDSTEENSKKERNFKLIEEIKTLLTYTNATPFKTKQAKYYCAYCSTEGPVFEDGHDLRIHTRNQHSEHRTYNVDHFMRPYWLNEILKLDIENLRCNICDTKLPDWNGMFQHFSNEHDIEFDEAYTRVVPYIIKDNIKCALCNELFTNFQQVDGHMNAHYNNYICYECGDTFVAASRLGRHFQIHSKGRFPCEECGKVFSLEKYRVRHINSMHGVNEIKCQYCSEIFTSTVQRHLHCVEKHKDRTKQYTCEFCGTTLTSKSNFNKHLQRKHYLERRNKCEICEKTFFKHYDLRNHMLQHLQPKKYVCTVCGEAFKKKFNFKHHFKTHHNDIVLKQEHATLQRLQ